MRVRVMAGASLWVVLALVAALAQALRNAAMKRLGHALDEYINVWGRFAFLLPFAGAAVLWRGWPEFRPGYLGWCAAFAVCQTAATLALSKALKHSGLGLATALWKMSLLVLLVLGWILAGERPSALGAVGVVLSAAGVYTLNIAHARVSPLAPLAVLLTDRGQRWALVSAFFYAPSVLTFKYAILTSDTATGTLGAYAAATLLMTPIALWTSAGHFRAVPRHWRGFAGLGLFAVITTLSQGWAYTLTLAAYVEAVKQVEVLFALVLGAAAFGEVDRVRAALPGAAVMLAGLVLLALSR